MDDVTIIRLALVAIAGLLLVRRVRRARGNVDVRLSPGAPPTTGGSNVGSRPRAQRYRNAAYIVATVGILLNVAWVAVRSPAWIGSWFRVLGLTGIAVGLILAGAAGWISTRPDP